MFPWCLIICQEILNTFCDSIRSVNMFDSFCVSGPRNLAVKKFPFVWSFAWAAQKPGEISRPSAIINLLFRWGYANV